MEKNLGNTIVMHKDDVLIVVGFIGLKKVNL